MVRASDFIKDGIPPKKKETLTSSQTWTAPNNIAADADGNHPVWVTMQGGGGAGGVSVGDANNNVNAGGGGGQAGHYTLHYKVLVTPGENITVTIGSGASGVQVSNGNIKTGEGGASSSFGNYVTAQGGDGGRGNINDFLRTVRANGGGSIRGLGSGTGRHGTPGAETYGSGSINSEDLIVHGAIGSGSRPFGGGGGYNTSHGFAGGSNDVTSGGGGGGIGGSGTDGVHKEILDGNSASASANTGAGSGGTAVRNWETTTYTANSGDAGSGLCIIEYFVKG